jgi:hypothetical protein
MRLERCGREMCLQRCRALQRDGAREMRQRDGAREMRQTDAA